MTNAEIAAEIRRIAANTTQTTRDLLLLANQLDDASGGGLPPPQRTIYFGYYGDTPDVVPQVQDHANLVWAYGWPSGTTAIDPVCKQAHAAGLKIMLGLYGPGTETHPENLPWFLDQVKAAGVASSVVAFYPMDEPDVAGWTDARVVQMNANIRTIAARYPEFAHTPIAVFYGPGGRTPGIASYDWVGRDNYGNGPQSLPLNTGQHLMVIGGADWGEPPDAYVAYAQSHKEVIAVIDFHWPTGYNSAWKAAGKTLTGKP